MSFPYVSLPLSLFYLEQVFVIYLLYLFKLYVSQHLCGCNKKVNIFEKLFNFAFLIHLMFLSVIVLFIVLCKKKKKKVQSGN